MPRSRRRVWRFAARRRTVMRIEHPDAHYRNAQYKIGAVIDLADSEHPVIQLDGDRASRAPRSARHRYVDDRGRPILRVLDADSVVVFVTAATSASRSAAIAIYRDSANIVSSSSARPSTRPAASAGRPAPRRSAAMHELADRASTRRERVDVRAAAQLAGAERERLVDAHDVGGERLGERRARPSRAAAAPVVRAEVRRLEPGAVRHRARARLVADRRRGDARRADREVARGDGAGGGERALRGRQLEGRGLLRRDARRRRARRRAPSPPLELGLARRARERDHVADVLHAGRVDDRALEAEAEAGVRHGAVAAQVAVPAVVARVAGPSRRCRASSTSSRSSRWLPPMISPMPGASTSIAATVLPSSFRRM